MQVNNKPQNQTPCHSTFNNCHHNVYQRPRLLQHFIPVESWWKLSARPNLWNGNLTCHNLGLFLDLECDWTTVLHTHTSILRLFFWDHPGEPVPAELLDFAVQGKINRGRQTDHPLGATPSGLTSTHLHHPPFLQAECPSCRPTNSVKALKASSKNQQSAVKMQLHFLSYTNTSNLSKVEVYSLNECSMNTNTMPIQSLG